ncbi:MAG TPA: EamA family transporter [Chloroflexota bacterium]|nr:EamA family transporter [Chloroflexota bacterium]
MAPCTARAILEVRGGAELSASEGGGRVVGIAAGLGAAAIWGGMYVVSKYVLDYVPPLTLVVLRLVIGTATLGVIAVATGAPWVRRRDVPLMVLLGFVGLCVSMVAQFSGTKLSTAASGALITCATPAFMLLFSWPLLGERPTARQVMGLALASAGVAMTILLAPTATEGGDEAAGRNVLLGNVLLVVAAVTWALYSVLGRIASRRYPALITTGYATFFGAVFTAPLVPLEWGTTAPRWEATPGLIWPGVLYLGVVSTAGAFYLWNKSIALLGPGLPAILFFAQPVVGGLLGALLLGERLGLSFFLGGALVGLAILLGNAGASGRRTGRAGD